MNGQDARSTIDIIYLFVVERARCPFHNRYNLFVVEQAGKPVLEKGAQCEEISRDTALPCPYLCYKIIIKNGFPRYA